MRVVLAVDPVGDLAGRLRHTFADPSLLELALTHRSYCAEHPGTESNERLEFLGDSVLGLAVTERAYAAFPDLAEGDLAKLRATVVSAPTLAEVAAELGLGDALRLGKGEDASGGRAKQSLLCDALEAVIGAVYLDGGLEAARRLVLRLLEDRMMAGAEAGPGFHDFKTQLQELAARRFDELPRYQLRDEGPDHQKRFHAVVVIGGEERGVGEGGSKKAAEQAAARAAWEAMVVDLEQGGGHDA